MRVRAAAAVAVVGLVAAAYLGANVRASGHVTHSAATTVTATEPSRAGWQIPLAILVALTGFAIGAALLRRRPARLVKTARGLACRMRPGGFEPPTNGLEGRRSSTELRAPEGTR
jgi:hypothetical protein